MSKFLLYFVKSCHFRVVLRDANPEGRIPSRSSGPVLRSDYPPRYRGCVCKVCLVPGIQPREVSRPRSRLNFPFKTQFVTDV